MGVNENQSYVMAERLKKLRQDRGLSHAKLSETIKKLYDVEISKNSLQNYEVTDPYHTKARKNQGMCIEFLNVLSDFYGVSTDYLMGRTDKKTPDPVAQAAIEYTGLTEENVKSLHFLVENKQMTLEIERGINFIGVDGCTLVLDCFNDIFDALMGDKKTAETIARYYMRMRQESGHLGEYPSDEFYAGTTKEVFQGLHSERESNIIVEHSCVKIGREIEKKLKRKYMGFYLEKSEK